MALPPIVPRQVLYSAPAICLFAACLFACAALPLLASRQVQP
jgi:hypothetical protein